MSIPISKRWSRMLASALGLALICIVFTGTAAAQTWNKKTTVTFTVPVEIPGAGAQILPAGTYVFRLLDSQADRHIVQVLNKDETHLFANILAIPNFRLKATDKTVMTFGERNAGDPQAIRAWFYPGDNTGQEFVYPKKRAVELAKITNQPILYIPDEVAVNIAVPVASATEPAVVALERVPVSAVKPTGEDIALTEVVEVPPVQVAGLPKTASNLPFVALMGFLCLGMAISFRALCDR